METETMLAVAGRPRVDAAFVLSLVLGDKKKGTIRTYKTAFQDFATYARTMCGVQAPKDDSLPALAELIGLDVGAANAIVKSYRVDMSARGLQPATVNSYLSAVRSYVAEAKRCGLCTYTLDVASVSSKSLRDTAGPGYEGYKNMLAHTKMRGDDAKSRRDMALLRLLFDVGLRRAEVATLDLCDFDPDREWGDGQAGGLRIIQKRDSETTWVGVPKPVLKALLAWIELRGSEQGPLFVNLDRQAQNADRRLSTGAIWKLVKSYGEKAGIKKNMSPHRLRHGGATRAAQVTNGNAPAVQAWGRWRSLDTAERYILNDRNLQACTAAMVSNDF